MKRYTNLLLLISLLLVVRISALSNSKNELGVNFGFNHNQTFKPPNLAYDTSFNQNGGVLKSFPTWGYYLGLHYIKPLNKTENLFMILELDYSFRVIKLEMDKSTATLYKKYFQDPAYKETIYSNSISIPIFISYKMNNILIGAGLNSSIIQWYTNTSYGLSGETYSNSSNPSFYYSPSFAFFINYKISTSTSLQFNIDRKVEIAYNLNYFSLGLTFKII